MVSIKGSAGGAVSVQLKRLQELLAYVAARSPFYRDLFARHQVDISKITSIEDLPAIPVTTKEDLQRRNNDFLCVAAPGCG